MALGRVRKRQYTFLLRGDDVRADPSAADWLPNVAFSELIGVASRVAVFLWSELAHM